MIVEQEQKKETEKIWFPSPYRMEKTNSMRLLLGLDSFLKSHSMEYATKNPRSALYPSILNAVFSYRNVTHFGLAIGLKNETSS